MGEVRAGSGWGGQMGALGVAKAENALREQTTRAGGNVLYLTQTVATPMGGTRSTGEAYRCQSPGQ
jgi:hypothetical protein